MTPLRSTPALDKGEQNMFNKFVIVASLLSSSPISMSQTAGSLPPSWELNNDPIALEFAAKEINYEIFENYILARSEDAGTEKVRILKLKAGDTRSLVKQMPTFNVESLGRFTRQTLARGIKGLELNKRELRPTKQSIQFYQYQIQGSSEPLVVSAYSFTRQGEVFVATHLGPLPHQRTYQPKVLELVERLALK